MQRLGTTIGIIADDLTGACDTALQVFQTGAPINILPALAQASHNSMATEQELSWAINTDSRHMDRQDAIAAVRKATALLRDKWQVDYFYKKMDSTLRGHFTDEILAMVDELGAACAVVVPAYPHQHRRTVGGYHLLDGIPIEQTELVMDPRFPVRQSHIPTIMEGDSTEVIVGYISLATVLRGAAPVLVELNKLIEAGKKLIVVDACSDIDLNQIALALDKAQKNHVIIPCGSAGLANSLTQYWNCEADFQTGKSTDSTPEIQLQLPKRPVLMLMGSTTTKTQQQIKRLDQYYSAYETDESAQTAAVIDLSTEQLLGKSSLASVESEVLEALKNHGVVVLASALHQQSVESTLSHAKKVETLTDEATIYDRIQLQLTTLVRSILSQTECHLVISGGETAAATLNALDCQTLSVRAAIEPAIPLLKARLPESVNSNLPASCWIVTKSGNFGEANTLVQLSHWLSAAHKTPATSTSAQ